MKNVLGVSVSTAHVRQTTSYQRETYTLLGVQKSAARSRQLTCIGTILYNSKTELLLRFGHYNSEYDCD